ncbi:MAG: beta-ketoacyl-[acyl-carrier-protein] synthase family protein [Deltaproteobacteria bacterium]|nr:beta-ketoacyl-[acyl-carrier-protein] synthase family protein [Deltaproteobacteria bacterium]
MRTVEQKKRVVVTGLGAITSAGPTADHLRRALHGESTCLREVSLFSTEGLRVHIGGEVERIPSSALATTAARRRGSRSDLLALCAVEEALTRSGLDLAQTSRERIATALGSSTGGMLETESFYATRLEGRPAGRFRRQLLSTSVGAPTELVAACVGALGPRLSPSTACSSSAIAIAMGLLWIRSGAADVVLAGGTDALCRMTFTGFHALQALSPSPCQPFDRGRQGISLGEGAGVLVLESEEHATARGAAILGEIAGAGISCDAAHPTAPHAQSRGAIQALSTALADAGVEPHELDYVNAHGTGTPQNDVCEATAIRTVLGEAAGRVPVSSTKGLIGHLLGAAGAVECIVTLLAVAEGAAPPTFGLVDPDSECMLDHVLGRARTGTLATAASNSYGFGGNNCTLIVRAA